jgi:DNA-binding response OmpR family regulator
MKREKPLAPAPPAPAVLLLEDDANLGFILQEHLQMQGYAVTLCTNGVDGLKALRAGGLQLCLVDVMMPRMDGFTFARELRRGDQRTPIIFLTAKSLKEDRIDGFKIGCDDYVTKPFSMEELMLRIQAVLRRSRGEGDAGSPAPDRFTIGAFTFDVARRLLRSAGGERKLTSREAELLRLLCLHRNRVLERELALKSIWGSDSFFNGRSMDVFISRLRRYLGEDPRLAIMNVHGKGFKLIDEGQPAKTPAP